MADMPFFAAPFHPARGNRVNIDAVCYPSNTNQRLLVIWTAACPGSLGESLILKMKSVILLAILCEVLLSIYALFQQRELEI
jgi:hypothetical protein